MRCGVTSSVACLALACVMPRAPGVVIPAGYDYFQTDTTLSTYIGFDPGTVLPAGFFGSRNGLLSDPVMLPTAVPLRGRPIGPIPPGANPNFFAGPISETARLGAHHVIDPRLLAKNLHDTIVRRKAAADLKADGDSAVIPIEIVALSLESVAPIQIGFGGGVGESFFDIWVTLDPMVPSPEGTMTITRTSATGGTLTSVLPVNFRAEFYCSDPQVIPSSTFLSGQIVFDGVGFWSTVPSPGAWSLLMIGGAAASRRRRDAASITA